MRELINRQSRILRATIAYVAVAVLFAGVPFTAFAAPQADIKINGSDGPVTITEGETWSYSWTSSDATACQLTSPSGVTGVTLAGNGGPIGSSHDWYPDVGGSTTLTISCTDGVDSTSDSVTVNVVADDGDDDDDGGTSTTTAPAADIKANGQDGTISITNGDSWSYSWTSSDASACQLTSPSGVTGVTLAGNGGPIGSSHDWYPDVGGSTTLTLNCTNGTDSVSDSVTINIVAGGGGGGGDDDDVSADIKINGQDGTVTITDGEEWSYSWTSDDATACQLTSPSGVTGVTLAGNGGPIDPDHDWYPDVDSSTTLTLDCTDGTDSASDSATVRVVAPDDDDDGGGGGGGGGSRRRDRGSVSSGGVTGVVPAGNFCPYITQYMRIDFNNDRIQVIRLQAFLQTIGGYSYVTVNGVFDEATRQAVNAFQLKYASEVLTPWGISQPTGYVYLLTARKINEIICGPQPAITVPQQQEIDTYVPPKEGVPEVGKEGGKSGTKVGFGTTLEGVPVVGEASPGGDNGQNTNRRISDTGNGFAAALFSGPQNLSELMQCLYEFVLILIVLYIIGSVLESVLYKDNPENVRKRFFTKWGTISAGLLAAIVGAYLLGEWCLILPLLITLLASAVWMIFYPKHNTIRERASAWQTSVSERTKKLLEETKESIEADQKAAGEKRS